jgi:hypothetical protein
MNEYRISVEKPKGKRPIGRPRCRRKSDSEMDHREAGWDIVDWTDLAQE